MKKFLDLKLFFEGLSYKGTLRKRLRHKTFPNKVLSRSFSGACLNLIQLRFDVLMFLKRIKSHEPISCFYNKKIFGKNFKETCQLLTDKQFRKKFFIKYFFTNILTVNEAIFLTGKNLNLNVLGYWKSITLSLVSLNILLLITTITKKIASDSFKSSRSFNILKRTYVKKLTRKFKVKNHRRYR